MFLDSRVFLSPVARLVPVLVLGASLFATSTRAQCPAAIPCGDANLSGAVDILDALHVQQSIAGLVTLLAPATCADVNQDGQVTVVDALLIAQFSAGLPVVLNCGPSVNPTAGGAYSITGTANGTGYDFTLQAPLTATSNIFQSFSAPGLPTGSSAAALTAQWINTINTQSAPIPWAPGFQFWAFQGPTATSFIPAVVVAGTQAIAPGFPIAQVIVHNPLCSVTPVASCRFNAIIALDSDGDGIADGYDNCPHVYNPDQEDVCSDETCCDPCEQAQLQSLHLYGVPLQDGEPCSEVPVPKFPSDECCDALGLMVEGEYGPDHPCYREGEGGGEDGDGDGRK
ncbi:MAG: dockerin type I domain-containing protein [Acidobacteriota bacterium]